MRRSYSSQVSPLLGGVAIMVALYTILFGGIRNFDTADAERILSEISTHLATESAARGKEARLQYSNVDIRGYAYEKWARISKLSLDFIYQQWQGGTRFGVSTEGADIIPDYAQQKRIIMRFGDTLNIISSSELLAMVRPEKPLVYSLSHTSSDAPDSIQHRLVIPGNLFITTLHPKQDLKLEFKSPARIDLSFIQPQRQLQADALFGPMRMDMNGAAWSLNSIDVHYNSTQKSNSAIENKGTLTLDRLAFVQGNNAPPPFTMTAAWSLKEQRNISGATDTAQLVIDHALLTDGDTKIAANGTIHFDIDDTPYGEVTIEVNNVLPLLKNGWILPSKEEAALALLSDITGEDAATHAQLIFTVAREKNGAWKVGKMPLETLLEKDFMSIFTFWETLADHEKNNSEETSVTNPS